MLKQPRNQSGYTLLEAIIVVLILVTLLGLLLIYQ
jgi:type II secretory pathway pseudopilin PulG